MQIPLYDMFIEHLEAYQRTLEMCETLPAEAAIQALTTARQALICWNRYMEHIRLTVIGLIPKMYTWISKEECHSKGEYEMACIMGLQKVAPEAEKLYDALKTLAIGPPPKLDHLLTAPDDIRDSILDGKYRRMLKELKEDTLGSAPAMSAIKKLMRTKRYQPLFSGIYPAPESLTINTTNVTVFGYAPRNSILYRDVLEGVALATENLKVLPKFPVPPIEVKFNSPRSIEGVTGCVYPHGADIIGSDCNTVHLFPNELRWNKPERFAHTIAHEAAHVLWHSGDIGDETSLEILDDPDPLDDETEEEIAEHQANIPGYRDSAGGLLIWSEFWYEYLLSRKIKLTAYALKSRSEGFAEAFAYLATFGVEHTPAPVIEVLQRICSGLDISVAGKGVVTCPIPRKRFSR